MGIFPAPQHPWGGSCPGGSVAIGNPERHVRKASHRGSKQQWRSCSQSLLLWLARATHMMVLFFTHITFVVNHTINATPSERLQQHPLLFTTNRSHVFCVKAELRTTFTSWLQHHFVDVSLTLQHTSTSGESDSRCPMR